MNSRSLADVIETLVDYRGKTPAKLGGSFSRSGVPVVSALHVKHGRLSLENARRVPHDLFERWMKTPLRKGDVILTSEAPLGEVARVADDEPLVLGQRLFALRPKAEVLDGDFFYYLLRHPLMQSRLQARATGTTVLGIRQSELLKVQVDLPPLPRQGAVARVLLSLDCKIDLNEDIARRCLQIADAQFLLTRERVRGSATVKTFDAFTDIYGGGTPSTAVPDYWGGEVAWATPTDVTALPHPYLSRTGRSLTDAGLAACSSRLHPAGSLLMTSRATIGAFAIAQEAMAVNQGFIVLDPRRAIDRWWLLHELMSRVDEMIARANGSTFLELSRGSFRNMLFPVPSDAELAAFHAVADPLHRRAAAAVVERDRLIALRDFLLPRLVAGTLNVAEQAGLSEAVA